MTSGWVWRRALCSYSHPVLQEGALAGKPDVPMKFQVLKDLKKYLQQDLQLQFCDICLESRKVPPVAATAGQGRGCLSFFHAFILGSGPIKQGKTRGGD
jgi:hypothetical protein